MCSFKSAVIFLGLDSISYIPRSIKLIAVKLSIKPQRVNGLDRSSCVVFLWSIVVVVRPKMAATGNSRRPRGWGDLFCVLLNFELTVR